MEGQMIPFSKLLQQVCKKYQRNPYFSFISVPKSGRTIKAFFENNDNKMTIERLFSRVNLEMLLRNEQFSVPLVQDSFDDGHQFVIDAVERRDYELMATIAQVTFALVVLEAKHVKNPFAYETQFSGTILDYKEQTFSDNWYRGQKDSSWGLIPSFLRNIDCADCSWLGIEDYWQNLDKNQRWIRQRYKDTMVEHSRTGRFYKEAAFLQHSISYSPFIDFTKSFEIAASFATANYADVNNFNDKDSAIFVLSFFPQGTRAITSYTQADCILRGFSVFVCKSKIVLGGSKTFDKRDGTGKVINRRTLFFDTFQHIIGFLTPKCYLFNSTSNDRMKYQKGTFVMFDDFLMINGVVLYNLNPNFHVGKLILAKPNQNNGIKNQILEEISKYYPKYKIEFLMDPYSYFASKN